MESTWERRDLPVLDTIVCHFDEHDGPEIPDVETFVKLTGMDPGQVARAVRALSPCFIKTGAALGSLMDVAIMIVAAFRFRSGAKSRTSLLVSEL
jgi:hypothetical protein